MKQFITKSDLPTRIYRNTERPILQYIPVGALKHKDGAEWLIAFTGSAPPLLCIMSPKGHMATIEVSPVIEAIAAKLLQEK